MKETVHQTIQAHHLLQRGETVFVAVSGGPDSMALLHFLWTERKRYGISVRACHVHHQLRDEEADEDARFVKDYCEKKGIPYDEKKIDVKTYAQERQLSTQVAARELRYGWFIELLQTVHNSCLATGHHGDDQIETIVMKMVRGSVPLQPYGIPLQRKLGDHKLIRPLLTVTKDEIESYCEEVGLTPRYDSSNEILTYTRNRIRHELLPILKRENPNVHLHMQRQNEWISDDHSYLMEQAQRAFDAIVIKKSDQYVTISCQAFLSVAVPLQRRLIHLILSYLCKKRELRIASIHIEQVMALFYDEKTTGELHLSESIFVRREYDLCYFSFFEKEFEEEQQQAILDIPGEVVLYDQWVVTSFLTDDPHSIEQANQIVLDYDKVTKPLTVRTRRSSDRIASRGMSGTKKLSRLFIDRKIPKRKRGNWPVLADVNGEILWVPFLHRTRFFQSDANTKEKLVISCRSLNGEIHEDG